MPVFLGMILGAALTVLGAYTFDAFATGPSTSSNAPAVQRTMVNWDVVGQNWRSLTGQIKQGWNRLSAQIDRT
jgi:hypothetical protein